MIKRIFAYIGIALTIFVFMFFVHKYVLEIKELTLSYSLFNVYLFNVIGSIIIYACIDLVAEKLPSEAGYAFLACVFLKIGFFLVLFHSIVFPDVKLAMFQRLSLLIPFFTYMLLEGLGIARLLNSKEY